LRDLNFVNIVNLMNDLFNPKDNNWLAPEDQQSSKNSEKGLYVREDDQDWGSAGMNNIQKQEVSK
jgi:hypothetical protein